MPRKQQFDPNQEALGFNMGPGTEAPPSGPVGPSTASVAPPAAPDAQAAMRAASLDLNPSRLPPPPAPPLTGWQGVADRALRSAAAGSPMLHGFGGPGVAASMGLGLAKGLAAPTSYNNWDTKMHNRLSGEGHDMLYGRGVDKPGLYAANTSKKWAPETSRQTGGQVSSANVNPREVSDQYPDPDPGHAMSMGAPGSLPGGPGTPQGLAPPGPAQDYMFKSKTSGTGTPWFDAHTAATSGLNAPAVQPIRAPETP